MEEFKRRGHSRWQETDTEEGKSPPRRLTLPPLTDGDKKKQGEKNKPGGAQQKPQKDNHPRGNAENKRVAFLLSEKPPFPLETASPQGKSTSLAQRKLALQEAELAKTLKEIKIITNLTHVKRNAIEELKQHSAHLAETNCRLMEDIQHTDDSTAKQARTLLQQHEELQRRKAAVRTCNQNQLDTARAELQELENTMEKNLGKLQQQLDEVTSKAQVLQDKLVVLRSYIDGQHPEPAVQIVHLQHSIRSLKKQQQEELEKTEGMEKAILGELQEKTRAKQEALLQKVVEEMLLHQDGLKQMVINNHILRREILRQREVIKDLEEEIGELKRSIQTLCQSTRDPRELMFADVFLCRPKCTPDTQVVLSIPATETPPARRSATLPPQAPRPAPSSGGLR